MLGAHDWWHFTAKLMSAFVTSPLRWPLCFHSSQYKIDSAQIEFCEFRSFLTSNSCVATFCLRMYSADDHARIMLARLCITSCVLQAEREQVGLKTRSSGLRGGLVKVHAADARQDRLLFFFFAEQFRRQDTYPCSTSRRTTHFLESTISSLARFWEGSGGFVRSGSAVSEGRHMECAESWHPKP